MCIVFLFTTFLNGREEEGPQACVVLMWIRTHRGSFSILRKNVKVLKIVICNTPRKTAWELEIRYRTGRPVALAQPLLVISKLIVSSEEMLSDLGKLEHSES